MGRGEIRPAPAKTIKKTTNRSQILGGRYRNLALDFPENYTTVATVSQKAIRENFLLFREQCGPAVKICPAVKANAYGHGVSIVAPVLAEAGADMFAVANLVEADELAGIVPDKPILVFGPVQGRGAEKAALAKAVKAGYRLTIADMAGARVLAETASRQAMTARVHVKIDTGMGRMGALYEPGLELVRFVSKQSNLFLEGLYTHFATADETDLSFTREQLRCFNEFLQSARGVAGDVPLIHAANSAAALRLKESHFSMVRPGISIYGYRPSRELCGLKAAQMLRPVMRLESRVVLTKDLPVGHSCGYGRTFRAERPTRIGIVPIGYGDGYQRIFSNRAVMLVGGKVVPVIGRVSMDQTILDLTDQPQVGPGDVVTVISERSNAPNSVEALAELANTIPYEITCLLGRRIARRAAADF